MKGMVCDYCLRQIIFTDSYKEREVINRGKRHTTVWNHYFIFALIAIYVSVLGLYRSWQADDTVWLYICAALAVAAIITLIFQRPKTLVPNHHKKSESVEEWLRNQQR
jgi:cell division protein FtsW (lipid II flippase)